jgi:hypothetical protein
MLHNARAPALSNLFPQFRVVHQAGQGPHKRIEVRRRHKQSVYTVADELRTPGEAGRYTGKFHGHGFRQRHGQALGKAGKAKRIGRRIKLADTILIDRAFKYDLCASFCRAARTARTDSLRAWFCGSLAAANRIVHLQSLFPAARTFFGDESFALAQVQTEKWTGPAE